MRITMNVLKMPKGFLGCRPGPPIWKQLLTTFLAKLKSTFRKRVSRVSCSSCPAWGHLLSLDVSQKIRDPNLNINVRNFGTNQRAVDFAINIFFFFINCSLCTKLTCHKPEHKVWRVGYPPYSTGKNMVSARLRFASEHHTCADVDCELGHS